MKRFAYLFVLFFLSLTATDGRANPAVYEPGFDPDVGFDLLAWHTDPRFGEDIWRYGIQSMYDAGFRSVSINPVRYFDRDTGILSTSNPGFTPAPELADMEAGIWLAHSLGMTVTVTPYLQEVGFPNSPWPGSWNPTPGSAVSNTFFNDYQQYLVDVARVAQANGANFMNVGLELDQLVENPGNNAQWTAAIAAAAANFNGPLGYTATWDDFSNPNLVNNIFQNPHISNMTITAYFPLTSMDEANASGTNPNPAFLDLLESRWASLLDDRILPLAHSLKGGAGMPVKLDVGYLPLNGATAIPYDTAVSNVLDRDEQIMAFKALLAALDHRKANDNLQEIDIWQWGMFGSQGSPYNMNLAPDADQPNNVPATQYLANYVTHPVPEPSSLLLAAVAILGELAIARRRQFCMLR